MKALPQWIREEAVLRCAKMNSLCTYLVAFLDQSQTVKIGLVKKRVDYKKGAKSMCSRKTDGTNWPICHLVLKMRPHVP